MLGLVRQALEREGVDQVFAYPGGCSMEIHQALTRSASIENVLCRHEQVSLRDDHQCLLHLYNIQWQFQWMVIAQAKPPAGNLAGTVIGLECFLLWGLSLVCAPFHVGLVGLTGICFWRSLGFIRGSCIGYGFRACLG